MAIFRRAPPAAPASTAVPPPLPSTPNTTPPKTAAAKPPNAAEAGRAAPEPLSIVLPAIAALGSISSIAAVGWLAEERTAERPRVKRRVDTILKDLETSCLGIAEILRRVVRHSPMFGLLGATSAAPLKFGLMGTRVDPQQAQTYIHLVNDIATMLVLATQASFDVTNAIEDGDIEPPEALFNRFGEAQARLNALLASRSNMKVTVETALAIAEQLTVLVRDLKTCKRAEAKP